jgi:hypothetical protein
MRCLVFASTILISLAACGSSANQGDDAPPDGPPISGDRYTLTFGPVAVAPGVEDTRCVTLRLGNPTPLKIHSIHNSLGLSSHHFIVYRNNDPAAVESATPTPCDPFVGTLNPGGMVSPMMITQRDDEVLTLPDGVAYSFEANQMIRLEMHFINTGETEAQITATAEFFAVPESEIQNEADFLFIGSPDINYTLQPTESATLQAYFPLPASLNGSNFFAITGHTHKLGTDMDVSMAPSQGGPRTEIYNPTPFSWSEPETTRHDPALQIADGGGFDFECTWTNNGTTAESFGFGESANDEMCFFWAYYYPSRGAKVCIHTEQGGGFDICCPDPANEAICNSSGSQL